MAGQGLRRKGGKKITDLCTRVMQQKNNAI